jgi:hypothetical protein
MDPVVEIVSQSDDDVQSSPSHGSGSGQRFERIILSEVENVAVVHENVILVSINTLPAS